MLAGYSVRAGYDFFETTHPDEQRALKQALIAWEMLLGDSPNLEATWVDWY
ncbi:hypothetical protein [Okeania sp. SIO2B3]|uniref:hypothetical protein n=1 Tax=Okeania sp. SIO2B3 TaxID=2607784 RepID=UPI0013C087A9|nr:hypothetical protein [Okeania sp. SIO2B3]NET44869.1 hypothetical protein [Okeania sp. SIO2B3]